ncbi:MAG: hypothetical protein N2446_00205 [Elusimicrobiales bacterium]|nr:hypothetical protein [Elusimicrobiales bacterium]
MKKHFVIIYSISLLFVSCIATQKDMIILQSQIDDLNSNIYTLKKNQADLMLKMDEVNRTIISFTETSKDLSSEMNKLSSKIDDYSYLTEKKINQLGKNITLPKEKDNQTKESKLIIKAIKYFASGKIKLAKESFKEYLSLYPKGENIELAYFYLAEICYLEKEFKEAAILYAKLITETPILINIEYIKMKYALSLIEMKDDTKEKEAILYLKDLEKNSKDSYIHTTAKSILNEISKKNIQKKSK